MRFYYKILIMLIYCLPLFGAGRGTVKGKILDAGTKLPLVGANVVIVNINMGAAADSAGFYVINDVPAGVYSLKFSYISYEPMVKTDIVVKPDRITVVDEELKTAGIETGSVVITGGYFQEKDIQPVSATAFSYEEIRRSPGAAGDVSRILMGLPSVAKVNDQSNSLIVRGGNPFENAFYIDNIEVPNINHFPVMGASGGPIGMVNVDFIKDVNFYSGGFSSAYGDKLSSVMELNFREGNREEIDGQLDLNFSGFGAVLEGPLTNKGSWLVSARRSYLDFLVKAIDVGTSIAPRYYDYQWKAVYDINEHNKISFIGLAGEDYSESNEEAAKENKMESYGTQKTLEATAGVNWQSVWSASGISDFSFSYNQIKYNENFYKPVFATLLLDNRSNERAVKFRNVNRFNFGAANSVEAGIDAKYYFSDYANYYGENKDSYGNINPASSSDYNLRAGKYGAFFNYTIKPFEALSFNAGVRGDYFSYNEKTMIDPRLSFSYKVSPLFTIGGSAGVFHQNLPFVLLMQSAGGKNLKNPEAYHYILSFDYLLTENTRLTLELYDKEYKHFPLDPEQPSFFIIDENIYNDIFYSRHNNLVDNGTAYTRGIELSIQKKLVENLYGFASITYFKSRYKALDNKWRDRVFDNRIAVNVEGGYKINSEWEVSARWIFAGGIPYTPFDLAASGAANSGIYDVSRVNEERNTSYHSLNVRVDKRFNFEKTSLIAYLSVWNVYNRMNTAQYFWNSYERKEDVIYQWSILPIFGLEYEF